MNGYRSLDNGVEVEFEVKQGPKGLQAENVQRV
jgi:CspA family cold shock protein